MPLCGIISSECLGTLPGAWAKQCENVLEVNACEWLRDTAWAASARGPAADQKQTAFRPPCLVKTQSCGCPLTFPDSHLLFHSWVSADRGWMPPVPTNKKKKKKSTSRYTQVGLCKPTWWVLHVVMFCPPLGCGAENVSKNQTWELRPINKSSETVAWQKRSVNVPKKGASM